MRCLRSYVALLLLAAHAAFAASTPFADLTCPADAPTGECMQQFLNGQETANFLLNSDGKLRIRLYRNNVYIGNEYYQVNVYDNENDQPGINLMIPKNDGDALVGMIDKVPNATGNELLATLEKIYSVLHIKRAWLTDGSEIELEGEGLHYLNLRLHAVLSREDQKAWYERKGYHPIELDDLFIQVRLLTDQINELDTFVNLLYGPDATPDQLIQEMPETSPELYALAKKVIRTATVTGLLRDLPKVDKKHPTIQTLREIEKRFPKNTLMVDVYRELANDTSPELYSDLWEHLLDPDDYDDIALGEQFFKDALQHDRDDRAVFIAHSVISALFDEVCEDMEDMQGPLDQFLGRMELLFQGEFSDENPEIELSGYAGIMFGDELKPKLAQKAFDYLTHHDKKKLKKMSTADRERVWLHEVRLPAQAMNGLIAALIEQQEDPDLFTFMLALKLVREKRHFVREAAREPAPRAA